MRPPPCLDPGRGRTPRGTRSWVRRSEEHTSELQSRPHLVCRLLLEKKNRNQRLESGRWIFGLHEPGATTSFLFRWGCSVPICCFFNDTATTEIYTLSLHDALPFFLGS